MDLSLDDYSLFYNPEFRSPFQGFLLIYLILKLFENDTIYIELLAFKSLNVLC